MTTDILFVSGGAFTGLEKIISARSRPGSIGFGAKVAAPEDLRQIAVMNSFMVSAITALARWLKMNTEKTRVF